MSDEVDSEDMIYRKYILSEGLELPVRGMPSTLDGESAVRLIKIRKEGDSAEIIQVTGRSFTVYTFEPRDDKGKEAVKTAGPSSNATTEGQPAVQIHEPAGRGAERFSSLELSLSSLTFNPWADIRPEHEGHFPEDENQLRHPHLALSSISRKPGKP
ncbi:hypothetical protein V5O48_008446 [Marasmius crinis-equi]|uniref:Uncharacterized protein n=1 Tax=Marasmius crinis-equi TaxID=585013 RepID=A0ABR3FDV3_9AGAR